MTYDEAVAIGASALKAERESRIEVAVPDWSGLGFNHVVRIVLDAIGYREMQEHIDEREKWVAQLILDVGAARALADQLARALLDLASYESNAGPTIKERAYEVRMAYEAEARDWRPISPPGSGLDGLLTDINRDSDS